MPLNNEQIVRNAYQIAEVKDIAAWVAAFTDDGTFTDNSIGVTYRGRGSDGLSWPVVNMARAFSDMHRELHQVYVSGDIVVVQLLLQGTQDGPFSLPNGLGDPHPARRDRNLGTALEQ